METILFAPETINLAETTRMIETAKAVRALGARCLFIAYSKKFAGLIEEAGFELTMLAPETTEEMAAAMLRFDQFKTLKNPYSKTLMEERVHNEITFIQANNVVKVVTGTSMSIFLSARICQTPLFYIKPFAYSRPQIEQGDLFAGFPFSKSLQRLALGFRYIPAIFTHVEKKYGVKIFEKSLDLFDGDYNLITSFPELTGIDSLPDDYQYIGFMYANLSGALPQKVHELRKQAKTLVYFSMGSSSNRKLIEKFLTIFSQLPYTFVCPVAHYLPEFKNEHYAENVYISDWLPTEQMNALVDFSIIHGGEGTVQTACASGKPFIGLGLQLEQRYNLQLCENYGNAIQLKKQEVSLNTISRHIDSLLNDPQFLEKAIDLKTLIETKEAGAEKAAKIICELDVPLN
ncbi:nucleotide disphospho-sugar-binding domain-containing protein [uncultured Enterococcus sp.]|uniref:glycosyltransferase n=1 Tax=uncultured Enterococcus sp. TaxID=167972 RepID=UPI002AA87E59|nr:nucleotide disphospho-sugar-binding domain-containing protein [uncultured Enterococcus sp.]